ncbi:hypothetical protein Astex_2430 [Asticcacaulis excentricus CB 48]|uniref:Uncharacterized protein n=1 Tax=Asticcacaulis excentricus (strain ATCC 15261 / DSM 4724 / KCTC 12464 / NCIMB 9791 / VKM B-1370 / CB 48) TaxID=573065 RepID=E8RUN1_ASTEC|nr:hypothetical protein Astex_2430 [Asticcacaulis excentricus CB 48]
MKNGNVAGLSPSSEAWRDTAAYRPYLSYDKRRWAWLWLQRKPGLQATASWAIGDHWATQGQGAHTLLRGDLNDLFAMGYLFMLSGRPTRHSTNGSSGPRISTPPSFRFRPNRYPALPSVRLT